MSALTPHIRSLRAQADAMERIAAVELSELGHGVLAALVKAKRAAADILEAEDQALANALLPKPGDVTFNAKRKP